LSALNFVISDRRRGTHAWITEASEDETKACALFLAYRIRNRHVYP
jgi:hypothetical protein